MHCGSGFWGGLASECGRFGQGAGGHPGGDRRRSVTILSTIVNGAMNIVITGASERIGAALATQLGSRGDRVVLAARRERELNEMAARSGPQALAVPTDVTRRAQV